MLALVLPVLAGRGRFVSRIPSARDRFVMRFGTVGSAVQGTADTAAASVQDVGVDHGRAHVAVAEQFLDGADVVAVF